MVSSWGKAASLLFMVGCALGQQKPLRQLTSCTVGNLPYVQGCSPEKPDHMAGFQIEIFDEIRAIVADDLEKSGAELAGGVKCFPSIDSSDNFPAMLREVSEPDGECDIGISGLTNVVDRRDEVGIQFAGIFDSSLAILTLADVRSNRGWDFLTPLGGAVWFILLISALLAGTLVSIFEAWARPPESKPGGFSLKKKVSMFCCFGLFQAFSTLLRVGRMQVQAPASKLVILGYGFLALVLISVYVASLSARLTAEIVTSRVNNVDDLQDATVGTYPIYSEKLENRGMKVVLEEPGPRFAGVMWEALRNGTVTAVVANEEWVSWSTRLNCDFIAAGVKFDHFEVGIGFPNTTEGTRLSAQFENAILRLKEKGKYEEIWNKHIYISSKCANLKRNGGGSIRFLDVWGLLIIFGAFALVSFAVAVWNKCAKRLPSYVIHDDVETAFEEGMNNKFRALEARMQDQAEQLKVIQHLIRETANLPNRENQTGQGKQGVFYIAD